MQKSISSPLPAALIALAFPLACLAQQPPAPDGQPLVSQVIVAQTWKHLPAPTIREGDVPRGCGSSKGLKTERSGMPANIGRQRFLLQMWGALHFKFPADCTDYDFTVSRWQETVGNPVTGVLSAGDIQKLDEAAVKAAPAAAAEMKQAEDALFGKVEAERLESRQRIAEASRLLVDHLPAAPLSQRAQCHLRIGKVMTALQAEQNRIGASTEIQRMPFGPARVQRVRERVEEFLDTQRQVHPQWAQLWQEQPVLREWAELYECHAATRFEVELWQQALGSTPDAMDPQLVQQTRDLVAKAQAQFAAEQSQTDHSWLQERRTAGAGRTLVLDDVDGRTTFAALVARIPTDRCSSSDGRLQCTPSPNCEGPSQMVAQGQVERQRRRESWPRPERGFAASSLGTSLQVQWRQSEQQLRRCELGRQLASRVLLADQDVRDVQMLGAAGKVASMQVIVTGPLQPVRSMLTQRFGTPGTEQVAETKVAPVFVPGTTGHVVGVGTVITQARVEMAPVNTSSTKYNWRSPAGLVEEHKGTLTFQFITVPASKSP